jgi:hypothetical protein
VKPVFEFIQTPSGFTKANPGKRQEMVTISSTLIAHRGFTPKSDRCDIAEDIKGRGVNPLPKPDPYLSSTVFPI